MKGVVRQVFGFDGALRKWRNQWLWYWESMKMSSPNSGRQRCYRKEDEANSRWGVGFWYGRPDRSIALPSWCPLARLPWISVGNHNILRLRPASKEEFPRINWLISDNPQNLIYKALILPTFLFGLLQKKRILLNGPNNYQEMAHH